MLVGKEDYAPSGNVVCAQAIDTLVQNRPLQSLIAIAYPLKMVHNIKN